jgi:hypothetical protein
MSLEEDLELYKRAIVKFKQDADELNAKLKICKYK